MKNFFGGPGGPFIIIVIVILFGAFFSSLIFANRGWGYVGYGGFFRPSVFMFGGPLIYSSTVSGNNRGYRTVTRSLRGVDPSLRQGSLRGTSGKRGGFGAGK